jgi:hypothetical protein
MPRRDSRTSNPKNLLKFSARTFGCVQPPPDLPCRRRGQQSSAHHSAKAAERSALLPQAGLFVYDSGAPNVLAKAGSAICASALGNHTSILRRARFFGTHAPRDKENQPKMPERKHAGDHPMLFDNVQNLSHFQDCRLPLN